MQSEKKETLAK